MLSFPQYILAVRGGYDYSEYAFFTFFINMLL